MASSLTSLRSTYPLPIDTRGWWPSASPASPTAATNRAPAPKSSTTYRACSPWASLRQSVRFASAICSPLSMSIHGDPSSDSAWRQALQQEHLDGLGAPLHLQGDERLRLGAPEPARRLGADRDAAGGREAFDRSEEHTSELQSQSNLVCRLLLEKKKKKKKRAKM